MSSFVVTDTIEVTQMNVLYVGHQINLDLQALSRAYPSLVSVDRVLTLFNSYTTFMFNYAISELGCSIHDPQAANLVYHELRYQILYGVDAFALNPGGGNVGKGGQPIMPRWIPASVSFTPWVIWSDHMLGLSIPEQEQIVSGTAWDIPSRGSVFNARYEGGSSDDNSFFGSGGIAARRREYSRE